MERHTLYRLLLLAGIFFGNRTGAAAQQSDQTTKRFGFKAGLNSTNMNFKKGYLPPGATPYETERRTGFAFGFLLAVPFTAKLSLQPEYLYSARTSYVKDTKTKYRLSYLSLPVLLRYEVSPVVSLLAGPQADLLIKAKAEGNGTATDITHDTEERNIGATAGIAVQVTPILFIEARYMQGLNHVGIGQRSSVVEFKYGEAQISLGLRF